MLEKLYRDLIERRAEMALAVFDSPPADWSSFQRRLSKAEQVRVDLMLKKHLSTPC